jgi:4'-phosphopantetheinyl transferase
MKEGSIQLWFAYPQDLLADGAQKDCASILTDEERQRMERFRFDRHRRESLATRALARTALSHCHPIPPDAWTFVSNAHGKPAIEPDFGLRFNLSNSLELVVCLIARGAEVGVDVEPYSRAVKIMEVAREVFSPQELAQLDALAGQKQLDRAVRLWTLKEAYIKARGLGMSIPFKNFSFLFDGSQGIELVLSHELDVANDPNRWRFCLFDHAGHSIALMVETSATPVLQIWEVRPPVAPPTQLPASQPIWFPRLERDT